MDFFFRLFQRERTFNRTSKTTGYPSSGLRNCDGRHDRNYTDEDVLRGWSRGR